MWLLQGVIIWVVSGQRRGAREGGRRAEGHGELGFVGAVLRAPKGLTVRDPPEPSGTFQSLPEGARSFH